MLCVNFQGIADEGLDIQNLFPGTTEGFTAGGISAADQIQIYNQATADYTIYYLFDTPLTIPALVAKKFKWVDANGAVLSHKFKNGDTFWFNKIGDGEVNINFAGQVSQVDNQTITIKPGWNMIGSAFPANFNPNVYDKVFWESSGATAGGISAADQIQIYNPNTSDYTIYYLFDTPLTIPALTAKKYRWVDASGAVLDSTTGVIVPGKGVWYYHQGNNEFTFPIPSPLK